MAKEINLLNRLAPPVNGITNCCEERMLSEKYLEGYTQKCEISAHGGTPDGFNLFFILIWFRVGKVHFTLPVCLPACVSVCPHMHVWWPQRTEKGIRSPGTRVTLLQTAVWELGITFGASERAASALERWAGAPALQVSIFINRSAKMTKYVGSHSCWRPETLQYQCSRHGSGHRGGLAWA